MASPSESLTCVLRISQIHSRDTMFVYTLSYFHSARGLCWRTCAAGLGQKMRHVPSRAPTTMMVVLRRDHVHKQLLQPHRRAAAAITLAKGLSMERTPPATRRRRRGANLHVLCGPSNRAPRSSPAMARRPLVHKLLTHHLTESKQAALIEPPTKSRAT
jgi:hypothetical protein